MAIHAVLFDWDGTIVSNDPGAIDVAASAVDAYARKYLGVGATGGDFARAFQSVLPPYTPGETGASPVIGRVIGEAMTWLGWPCGTNDVEACSRLFFEEHMRYQEVYDDARALLSSLKFRGYRVAVVSNAIFPGHYFETRVNELGLAGYIDSFVSSADVGLAKPNPAPFRRALADLGVEPHDAIFVGDSPVTDIPGARNAGMRAVLLQRNQPVRDRAGFLVIERLTALNGILGEGTVF
ncbi:MAG: HAD family hydrolase [Dehalococcoidia bacterium]|nr:HAD family hydrolase [Dehalococcoidia bacterium]